MKKIIFALVLGMGLTTIAKADVRITYKDGDKLHTVTYITDVKSNNFNFESTIVSVEDLGPNRTSMGTIDDKGVMRSEDGIVLGRTKEATAKDPQHKPQSQEVKLLDDGRLMVGDVLLGRLKN